MARPRKIGLDYFPLDVNLDDKVQSFELLHENNGFTWLIKFWQSAYKTEHGEVNLDGLFGTCSAKNSRITSEQQQEYLNTCKQLGLLYQTESGLWTSNGIKKRISMVSKERECAIKRKEKKLNKSKVKETPHCSANNPQTIKFPPSIEEVQKFILDEKLNVDANKWFNFYDSKGWMIGKNKMKSWQAAIRTWNKSNNENKPQQKDSYMRLR